MDDHCWQIQDKEPLFPDTLWSKPETKALAKRLVIIGGHTGGFDQVAAAYQAAREAGIGQTKVALPDKLRSVLAKSLPDAVFVPSSPNGTVGDKALNDLLSYEQWADLSLICQTSDNSESALCVTHFAQRRQKPLVLGDEAALALKSDPALLNQPGLYLVLSLAALQQVIKFLSPGLLIKHDMGLRPLALALAAIDTPAGLVTVYDQHVLVKVGDNVTSTKRQSTPSLAALAGFSAVWLAWEPAKPLAALSTAAFVF